MKRIAHVLPALLPLAVALAPSLGAAESKIEDAESSTHGYEAAQYQVVDTYEFPGFRVTQIDLAVLAHYSYLVTSGEEAIVVDPGRDVFTYLDLAEKQGTKIKAVWLSHSHADFVAGHIEVAKRLNVPIYISARANAGYEHRALAEGDTLEFGNVLIRFIETPGHTLDSMCAVVHGKQDPSKPLALLSGDTLFIGSVGRPDLLGKDMSASTLAGMMYDTWTDKLSKLPDDVVVLPAHGAGSLCGAHLSDEPISTIGQQKASNPYVQYTNRGEFIAAVLEGLPVAPQYFGHNAAINRQGPPLAQWEFDPLPLIEPSAELTDPAKFYVVDVRDARSYAEGHVPNSVNIGLRGRFETWVGRMVPWDMNGDRLVLVGDGPDELEEALVRLNRIGYRGGVVPVDRWRDAGLPLKRSEMVAPRDLRRQMQSPQSPLVVDVRLPKEWMGLRIGKILNVPLDELAREGNTLDRREKVVAVCNSAYRSSMAVGLLERRGFAEPGSLDGGTQAWIEAGLPVHEAKGETAAAAGPKHVVRLPERIAAAELKRMLMDLPGTFQLVDVRPPAHFADYRLPDSENVAVAELLGNPAYLTGAGPLVVVDRDGSVAMMAAGILSQKTERSVKALYGGLKAYWDEAGPGSLLATSPIPSASAQRPGSPAAGPVSGLGLQPSGSTPEPSEPAAKPKRRSAGC
jgi:glyoxylase-like metal-dependent hydrolase (beta-lactamase superfamily II)/rhodanese-related sulfurtransferase